MCEKKLSAAEILLQEFQYAAQTAFQAQEDRIRVFNYYFVTVGTIAATLVVADLTHYKYTGVLALLFAVLALLGLLTFLELIKLRLAWVDSVKTMCRIKDYYIQHCENGEVFRWTAQTIPEPGKKWSIAFLVALTIVLLDSLAAAAAGYVAFFRRGHIAASWTSALAGTLFLLGQIALWVILTREKKPSRKN